MLVECLMERYGWEAVWFLGRNGLRRNCHLFGFLNRYTCYVGTWTGPDLDLICVCRCKSSEEAEKSLSEPGYTILHAVIRSWLKLRRLRKSGVALEHCWPNGGGPLRYLWPAQM